MHNLPLLFPWSDSVSSVFLIWGKSPSSLVSVCSGNYLSEESGHRTQTETVFFFYWGIVFSWVCTELREQIIKWHSEQEERSIQKFYDLCYKGGWQKTLALIACFSLASFCFSKTFRDLEAKGDWEGNILFLMVILIFLYSDWSKIFS